MNLASSHRLGRIVFCAFALVLVAVVGSSANAGTVSFTAPSFTVSESPSAQTYTADVLISDTNTADIIGQFQLDLFLQSSPTFNQGAGATETNVAFGATTGFTFVTPGAQEGTSDPYLYNNSLTNNSNNSNAINFSAGAYLGTYTSALAGGGAINEVYGADTWATTDAAQMTQTWALAQLYITVAAGFQGKEYLVWNNNTIEDDSNAPLYALSPADSTPLDPTLVGGVITVVPEPGSVVLMVLGAVGLLGAGRLRRRRG